MLLKSINQSEVSSYRLKKRIQGEIKRFIHATCSDDLQLLEVVGGGPQKFRVLFIKAFPRGTVDETIANKVFAFLAQRVVAQFGDTPVNALLDAMEVNVVRPPTQDQIDNSWEVVSASSEEARRLLDQPTGDYRKLHPGEFN